MKKIIVLFLSMMLMFGLAACGNTKTNTDGDLRTSKESNKEVTKEVYSEILSR